MPASDQTLNFSHLSLKDLIEARDLFHLHLMNKRNVVATAVGRYLIRKTDLDENGKIIEKPGGRPVQKKARTLKDSLVVDTSWPCVLVFVEQWEEEAELLTQGASNIVPKTIFMPDGRIVPICIVVAPKQSVTNTDVDMDQLNFPVNYVGGGFPLIVHTQGMDHIASIGCIVSNGNKFYALTNKHVVGDAGETIRTKMGNDLIEIGISSGNTLGKRKFTELYPGWDNKNMLVSCDAGLIEISDVTRWKTDIIGLPKMDELYDLNTMTLTTGLIAEHSINKGQVMDATNGKVLCYGAVSGLVKGEILGLFYRYKSVGGVEYVSDFLIAGRNGENLNINHGDSGTVWMLEIKDTDNKNLLRPLALHWGQHVLLNNGGRDHFSYSLSTSLSNICRELDVELIRGWNVDIDYSWGKVGHYTVGNGAISAVSQVNNPELKLFMENNIDNISFRDVKINKDLAAKGNPDLKSNPDEGFCALADVPDIIWKQAKLSADGTRGTAWGRKGDENPNHYSDVDAPVVVTGETIFDICTTEDDMKTQTWIDYYNNIDKALIGLPADKPVSQGLVCFRVWQIYNYMVNAAKNDKADEFIFAAGVLAHYVGDSCQPLHSSYLSDGNPADSQLVDYTAKVTSKHKDGTISHLKGDVYKKLVNPGSGVHVAYEDNMIDDFIDQIFPEMQAVLADNNSRINKEVITPVTSGKTAAFATLTLMKLTQQDIKPLDIVEAYKAAKGNTDVSNALFDQFGPQTVDCLARGCRYLAAIWEGAWMEGIRQGGGIINTATVGTAELIALYREPAVLPSMHLDSIGPLL